MKHLFLLAPLLVLLACSDEGSRSTTLSESHSQREARVTPGSETALPPEDTLATVIQPAPQKVKQPAGIYRFLLPYEGIKIEHTVQFYPNHTYVLQEKYPEKGGDSITTARGTWAPSNGAIWLYQDEVVRARYKWAGDVLQYYNPQSKKEYPLEQHPAASENGKWQAMGKAGVVVYGVGNEPFWNISLDKADSLTFHLADWKTPVKLKVDSVSAARDSTLYLAHTDSLAVRFTLYPQFCSDGMSDYIYPHKVKVQYGSTTYRGCGMVFR